MDRSGAPKFRDNQGFTLLEMMISIGILLSLSIGITTMMRTSFDIKGALSQRSKVLHRMSVVMNRISEDMQHVYHISAADQLRNGIGRGTKTVFRGEGGRNDSTDMFFTTKGNKPLVGAGNVADVAYVVYRVEEMETATGRTAFYRGASPIPANLKDEPPKRLIAKHIKAVKFSFWNGEEFQSEPWDTSRQLTRDKLPHMVRVTVEAWAEDREDGDEQSDDIDRVVERMHSVFYIPEASQFEEVKKIKASSIPWEKL